MHDIYIHKQVLHEESSSSSCLVQSKFKGSLILFCYDMDRLIGQVAWIWRINQHWTKWEEGLGSHTKPKVSARHCMHKQILHAESRPSVIVIFFVQSKFKGLSNPFLWWYGSNDSAAHIGQVEKYGIWSIAQLWSNVRKSSRKPKLSARHFVDINRFFMKKVVPVASSSLVQYNIQGPP